MFVVGDEKKETFGANSVILSAASEVFDKNFYGEFERPSMEKPLTVEIPDGTPDGFRVLLECLEVFDKNAVTLMASKKFLKLNASLLGTILSRDTLEIDEMAVYRHTMAWAKGKIEQDGKSATPGAIRAKLGNLFYLIRFPTMDSEAFASGPEAANLLTDRELLDIYRWFSRKRSAGRFKTKPRHTVSYKYQFEGKESARYL